MLWILYNLLFPIVFLLMLPKFLSRMLKRGGYGQHFEQRVGHFGSRTKERIRAQRRIWVHAVSVGEIYVALKFMKAYRAAHPDAYFALSVTTSTAHRIGREQIDERDVLFYFPVDLPVIIKKVLRIINPLRIVLVEGEFWPNLIRLAHARQIPVSLINGRMSENSYKGYRKLKSLTADILRRIDPICVQGQVDADRMLGIGAPEQQVHIMGTVKFDVAERDPAGEAAARAVLVELGVPDDAVVVEQAPGALAQIVTNLLKNALEACGREDQVTVRLKPTVFRRASQGVEIAIVDSGPGLPAAVMANLAEPKTSSKGGEHQGVGMQVAYRLAAEHGVEIDCETSASGTEFRLYMSK